MQWTKEVLAIVVAGLVTLVLAIIVALGLTFAKYYVQIDGEGPKPQPAAYITDCAGVVRDLVRYKYDADGIYAVLERTGCIRVDEAAKR